MYKLVLSENCPFWKHYSQYLPRVWVMCVHVDGSRVNIIEHTQRQQPCFCSQPSLQHFQMPRCPIPRKQLCCLASVTTSQNHRPHTHCPTPSITSDPLNRVP